MSLSFSVCVCVFVCLSVSDTFVRTGRILAKIINVKNNVCRFWHLPSNTVIAQIVLRDLDLNFHGQVSKSSICHLTAPLRMLYIMTFDLHFQGHEFWNVNISKMVRSSKKCLSMTFIEFDICHRIGPFQMLYSVTLTYIFKLKLCNWLFWQVNARKRQSLLLLLNW